MLSVDAIEAGYGPAPVLFGVSLAIGAGEALGLMGRNGMGKTTLIRTIVGAIRPTAGHIHLAGHPAERLPPHRICRLGVGYVPEGRRIFRHLTVTEQLAAFARGKDWSIHRVFELFPALADRRTSPGGLLSGGEQQMLAIGRALMTGPALLILDEATEGLAPLIRARIWTVLAQLKALGMAVLVVDKNLRDVLALVDRVCVLEKGRVAFQGAAEAFSEAEQRKWLSV